MINVHGFKLLSSCSPGSKIDEYMSEHSLFMIVTDVNGNSNVIELPRFDRVADCDLRVLDEQLNDLANAAKYVSSAQLSSSLTSFISTSELVSFSSSPGTSSSLSLDSDSFLESSEFMESEYGFQSVRKVGFY
uniref:Uncharacterized protein n=1 Tax=Panagrolaimus sp. ES5 TaxID=591445 RepID=A0AC34GMG6_9BILA